MTITSDNRDLGEIREELEAEYNADRMERVALQRAAPELENARLIERLVEGSSKIKEQLARAVPRTRGPRRGARSRLQGSTRKPRDGGARRRSTRRSASRGPVSEGRGARPQRARTVQDGAPIRDSARGMPVPRGGRRVNLETDGGAAFDA